MVYIYRAAQSGGVQQHGAALVSAQAFLWPAPGARMRSSTASQPTSSAKMWTSSQRRAVRLEAEAHVGDLRVQMSETTVTATVYPAIWACRSRAGSSRRHYNQQRLIGMLMIGGG